jgi:hypothetical protein
MNPHRAAVRLEFVEPTSAIRGTLPLDLGRLESDLPNFRIRIHLNAGRIGLPAAELRIQMPTLTGGNTTELRMAFEPGVHAPSAPGANRYNLQQFSGKFQGRPGGAGSMYREDHPDLRGETDVAKKKRTLKMKITTHGFVPYPDTFAMDAILGDARTPPTACDFIRMLRDATAANMIWYCMFDADVLDRVRVEIVDPFQTIINQRRPPLSQYDPTRQVLTLDMARYKDFGNKMYCTADQNIPGGFTGPRHHLPDMQGRTAVDTVAKLHIIGHIREFHGQKDLNQAFCNTLQDIRVVKSKYEIHRRAPGDPAAQSGDVTPNDCYVYVIYINVASAITQDYDAPPPGARFQIFWQTKVTESAYGIVLDVLPSTLREKNAAFVMALFKVPPQAKGRAATRSAYAKPEKVRMVLIPNRMTAQAQLDALHRYANMSNKPVIVSLKLLSVYRRSISKLSTRDIRGNAATWNRALIETRAYPLQNRALTPGADNMLTQLVQHVDRYIELLETPLQGPHINACLALTWQFLATGLSVIIVSDHPESRSDLAYQIWEMRRIAVQAPEFGNLWFEKKLLAYTCSAISHDGDSPAAVQTRRALDLSSRYLDDLPNHEWPCDESGNLGQSVSINRRQGSVPPTMSMGNAIHAVIGNLYTPQARRQYYLDRQQDIDNTRPASTDVKPILEFRNALELQIIQKTDVLITDSATAVTENVRNSMKNAVLIYMDTQATPFSTVAATIASYPNAHQVFVCGNRADNRYRLRWYARNDNEARAATAHGAWNVFVRAGNVPHSLA